LTINSSEELATSTKPSKIELNIFGLKRMLETATINIFRIYCIWEYLAAHFEFLAKLKGTQLRPLAISTMVCVIMNGFEYYKENTWEEVKSAKWSEAEWQTTLLTPLMNAINIGCITEVVINLRHIIENCGLFINKEGWKIVLAILEKVSTPLPATSTYPSDYNERMGHAFKCLEQICVNSLYKIHISNLYSLIAVICQFTSMKSDLNISLRSVAYLQNVADYVAQQQVTDQLKDTSEETVSEIWISLLNRLKETGIDEREELRGAAYRTLDQIIEIHGSNLSLRVWTYVILSLSTQLLQFVTMKYLDSKSKNGEEEEKIKEKGWENSVTILYTVLVRITRKLSVLEQFSYIIFLNSRGELIEKIWSVLVESFLTFSKSGSCEILKTIYKLIEQMINKYPLYVYNQIENTWKIYVESITYAKNEVPSNTRVKPLLIKLNTPILESFNALFNSKGYECKFLMSEECLLKLYELLKAMLMSISSSVIIITDLTRLISEEREVFDFIEYLFSVFTSTECFNNYFAFLFGFLEFDVKNPHTDAFVRRALMITKNFITSSTTDNEVKKKLIQILYSKLGEIIGLRFDNESNKVLQANAKDSPPLWFKTGEFFISISTFLLNPKLYINNTCELEEPEEEPRPVQITEVSKEIKDIAWTYTINISKEILDISGYERIDRGIVEDTVKRSEELGKLVVEFVLEILLPYNEELKSQKELIYIIDKGCQSVTLESIDSPIDRAPETRLSQFCIFSLIRLCNNTEDNILSMKEKLASITTRILVNRSKKMLQQYIADEKRNAQVPLPR